MKFQKILMTGCKDMNIKLQKFSPICSPARVFFQKSGSVTFVSLWCPNFMVP